MKPIANFIWLITFGWILALAHLITGVVLCITIIFIPVGLQYFKLARFVFTPFGYDFVDKNVSGFKTVINLVWAVLLGWELALLYLVTGLFLCVTIIFIPVSFQLFKLASFILLPLGKTVKRVS